MFAHEDQLLVRRCCLQFPPEQSLILRWRFLIATDNNTAVPETGRMLKCLIIDRVHHFLSLHARAMPDRNNSGGCAKERAIGDATTSLVAGGRWRERSLIAAPTIDERLSDR